MARNFAVVIFACDFIMSCFSLQTTVVYVEVFCVSRWLGCIPLQVKASSYTPITAVLREGTCFGLWSCVAPAGGTSVSARPPPGPSLSSPASPDSPADRPGQVCV